jgi:NAD(P)H-hydrate epimerase
MKIFSAAQIWEWDRYTIENEPVTSVELMNRASRTFAEWFIGHYPDSSSPVVVVAGTGNNGGDGLAVARYLHQMFYDAKVLVYTFDEKRSADFEAQTLLLPKHDAVELEWSGQMQDFPAVPANAIVIDALFGSGLNRPLTGEWANVVQWINSLPNEVVSIDLPSGLFADESSKGHAVVCADKTFSFETPKRAFFFPENADRVGEWHIGSIGLHPSFAEQEPAVFHYLTFEDVAPLRMSRKKYAHKGTFGHALLVCGSYGKIGAAILAAKACLRSGVGLLTVHVPKCGYEILQTAVPEAMTTTDHSETIITQVADIQKYTSIGIGSGIGTSGETASALEQLIREADKPLVLDADALNLLAQHAEWWTNVPENSILTPHLKEFERLFGSTSNDFERNDLQREKAREHRVFIVLKGAHTAIATPEGACWFNATGNPGMATGGTGDALTGIITGLLAQGYSSLHASLLGVYLHGLAGDEAAKVTGEEALTAGDLIAHIGAAWKIL